MSDVFELGQEFIREPTSDGLRAWQARMGFGYDSAADALGISRSGYALMLAGNTPGREVTRITQVDRCTALACVAIEAGLSPFCPLVSLEIPKLPTKRGLKAKKPSAVLVVKRRSLPMLAAVVAYNVKSGRTGKVLASEVIRSDFSTVDLTEAARRLVPQVDTHDVILPAGVVL